MSLFTRRKNGVGPAANGHAHELYDLLERAGDNACAAAELLHDLMRVWPEQKDLHARIVDLEHEGDRLTHDIIHRLHRDPAAPIDREDIFALATALDDVVDYTEEAADFLGLYKVEAPMEQAQRLSRVLVEACRSLAQALARLESMSDLGEPLAEVNRLENEGDRIVREALASLFEGGVDPIVIIRWKDVFDRLEQAIDACEHAAHILEGILVKHSQAA